MKLAIMQPYFLPYIGYFQLINAVDKFVIYDNIEFTKKGWINRNRILVNSKDEYITLPLKKASDFLHIYQRMLSDDFFSSEKEKLLRKIKETYRKAPFFKSTHELIEDIFSFENKNLFYFVFNSIEVICKYLEIKTEFIVSSTIPINHTLKSEEKVLAICEQLHTDCYINPIGGTALYSKENFKQKDILLLFLKAKPINYVQNGASEFVPLLSILDVMMFNSKDFITEKLNFYELI